MNEWLRTADPNKPHFVEFNPEYGAVHPFELFENAVDDFGINDFWYFLERGDFRIWDEWPIETEPWPTTK